MDTIVALYHYGLEDCSEDEFEVRELLLYWRDNHVRKKMGSLAGITNSQFHENDLRSRLDENKYWADMKESRKRHLLKKADTLHSPEHTLEKAGFDTKMWSELYAYWSAHTHCNSVAFHRMEKEGRGTGSVNEVDLGLSSVCINFTAEVLTKASYDVDLFFKGASKRALSVSGFNPLNMRQPKRPWAGKSYDEL